MSNPVQGGRRKRPSPLPAFAFACTESISLISIVDAAEHTILISDIRGFACSAASQPVTELCFSSLSRVIPLKRRASADAHRLRCVAISSPSLMIMSHVTACVAPAHRPTQSRGHRCTWRVMPTESLLSQSILYRSWYLPTLSPARQVSQTSKLHARAHLWSACVGLVCWHRSQWKMRSGRAESPPTLRTCSLSPSRARSSWPLAPRFCLVHCSRPGDTRMRAVMRSTSLTVKPERGSASSEKSPNAFSGLSLGNPHEFSA